MDQTQSAFCITKSSKKLTKNMVIKKSTAKKLNLTKIKTKLNQFET